MQKKLIALAIAGLSTTAFAQSNVTISGRFSVGVESSSAGGATAAINTTGNTAYTSRFRAIDNNSNIRFAGEEALGGGTSAWFQVESAIGTTNNVGTTGGLYGTTTTTGVGTRNTAVGLKGAWGTALIGKWDVHYQSMAAVDANGLTGGLAVNTNSINLLNSINGAAVIGSGRDNNLMAYISPNWNGFSFLLGYTTVGQANTAGLARKDGGWQFKPTYSNGPLDIAYSHLSVNAAANAAPNAAGFSCLNSATGVTTTRAACLATEFPTAAVAANSGNGVDVSANRLGVAYSFPMGFKVGLIWDKSKMTNKTGVAGDTWMERTAWALPMSYTTGAHKISFTYAKTNDMNTDTGSVTDSSAKMAMLGYEYSLSKRTIVGVAYTQLNNGTAGRYDFWHPSSNVSGGQTNALTSGLAAGVDPRSFSVNLAHTF